MRKRIYEIIEAEDSGDWISKLYNIFNIFMILFSLLPLMFKNQTQTLVLIDWIAVSFFIFEYFLRLLTADYAYPEKEGAQSFLYYPISPYGIIDLLSILPSFNIGISSFRILRLFRLFRSFRVFRAFKLFRYSKSASLLWETLKKQRKILLLIAGLTVLYILLTALVLFNVEPETFPSFIEALYWSTMSLTTATFGNKFPKSTIGQVLSIISLLIGVIIIALPTSIITAGYTDELTHEHENPEETEITDDSDLEISEDDEDDSYQKSTYQGEKPVESSAANEEYLKRIIREVLEERDEELVGRLKKEMKENK